MTSNRFSGWRAAACVAGLVLAAVESGAVPYVVLPNETKVEGTEIRVTSKGDVILTTVQGQRTFTKGQYVRAVADKPAEFDKARQMAAAKQYAEAEKVLKELITRLVGLEWDVAARIVLGREVYGPQGNHLAAVATFEELLRAAPERKSDGQVMWAYREAMLNAKQYDKLGPQLNELIASGPREEAGRAYVLRGDLKLAQQETEPAALDYLRAAFLFENEESVQPEALFKAGQTLEKLRDPKAPGLYEKLKSKYPASPYTAKIGAR